MPGTCSVSSLPLGGGASLAVISLNLWCFQGTLTQFLFIHYYRLLYYFCRYFEAKSVDQVGLDVEDVLEVPHLPASAPHSLGAMQIPHPDFYVGLGDSN